MLQRTIEKMESFNVLNLYVDQKLSTNQIEKIVKSDKRTIIEYLNSCGVEVKGQKTEAPFDINLVIKLYKEDNSINQISEIIKVEARSISKYLKLEGIEIINKGSTGANKSGKRFNENIFDIIDTEEKAYWLGFIFADGYIETNENRFGLDLQAQDVGHLHDFNLFMQCNNNNVIYHPKITNKKIFHGYRWIINNKHLWNTLNDYGCTPKKSLTLKFPNENIFKSKDLIRHFIRGYWDGDGCICFTIKTKIISVLGTENMLNNILKFLPIRNTKNLYANHESNITKILQFEGKYAFEILQYLYENSTIYLNRKYNKYLEFCRLFEGSNKLLEDKDDEDLNVNIVLTN